ncbi:MAG: D-alanyl-D-alanine carboxypeptidase [Candidatus Nanopelagicales bacterium]
MAADSLPHAVPGTSSRAGTEPLEGGSVVAVPGRILAAAAATVALLAAVSAGPAVAAPSAPPGVAVVAPPVPPLQVLPATTVTGSTVVAPMAAALAATLTPLLRSPALGSDASLSVVDPATGAVVYESFGGRPQPPASTLKVLTAATALRLLGPDTRLSTRVVLAGPGRIVLVGGGDPSLTRRPAGASSSPPGQRFAVASLDGLAARTVAALSASRTTTVSLDFDDSLFGGPRTAPGWPVSYVATGVVSPVDALSADGGQVAAGAVTRSADPGLAAATYFARRLAAAGIKVAGTPARTTAPTISPAPAPTSAPSTATAPTTAPKVLAAVWSPTVADLVEQMLTVSDDDTAETFAHLCGAKESGFPGTFANGATAMLNTLTGLGVSTVGVTLRDGSGLSLLDEVPASTLATTVAAIAVPGQRTLAAWPALTGMPVAGATGTLTDRFTGNAAGGRGVVRAKTGTLTGVVTLAGTVRTAQGQLLAFAVMADRVVVKVAAQHQVDRIAAALVG